MKILFLSCHAILEHDEYKMLTELGNDVFSFGSYQNPAAPHDNKRPPLKGKYDDHLQYLAIQCSKENLEHELIEWADLIIVMHRTDWILNNWEKMKGKSVIWRTIGQSVPDIESQMVIPKQEGVKIVRYSPEERNISGFAGEDAMIRFYKDEKEFDNWNGKIAKVITVAQSMNKRFFFDKYACRFDIFNQVTEGLPRSLYGPDNEDSGIEGGLLTYAQLKKAYRDNRVYFYTGSYPASYTLNLMEAMMTGIPVVAIGRELANLRVYDMDVYEVDKILNGTNGFCSNNVDELREKVKFLLDNPQEARKMGEEGRKTAIELWGKDKIYSEWREFLKQYD
jgi:glycosyltransferase involved in cell wall biosynthesis